MTPRVAGGPPSVSVVIPTYNRRDLVRATLESLDRQRLPRGTYEAVVVVDGSTDGTAEMLRVLRLSFPLHVVVQANRGPGAARNAGVARAGGELILFLDDDLECDSGLLAAHLRGHEQAGGDPPRALFGPVLISPRSPDTLGTAWARRYTGEYTGRLAREEPRWPDDAIVDANTSIRRHVVIESGGFDERFLFPRDTAEFGLRLWARGVRFRYTPDAVVEHVFVKSADDIGGADAWRYGRNELHVCRIHPGYRPRSALAALCQPSLPGRTRFHLATQLPAADRPPAVVHRLAERLPAGAREAAGLRALQLRHSVTSLRAAAREAGSARELGREVGMRLPVLIYHHVGPPAPGTFPELTVSPAQLERDLRLLVRWGFTAVTAAEWVAWCLEGAPLPPKPVLLTFDDAYVDVATHALPLMGRLGLRATVFAVAGRLGGTNSWDEALGSGPHRLMSAADLATWAARGVEIGAHSSTHPRLPQLPREALEREVRESGETLARATGAPVRAFAYPYGAYDDGALEAARAAFTCAFTVEEGLNGLATPLHRLRRTMVQPSDTPLDLWCRLSIGWSPIHRLRAMGGALIRWRR